MRKKKKEIEEIKKIEPKKVEKIIPQKIEDKKEEKVVVEENLEPIFYILGTGEDLSSVAKKFNTSVDKINKLNQDSTMFAGNQIRVQ